MKERSDEDLVTACLEGDGSSFAELVDRYQIKIFNAAYRITGNRVDSQDVAQAVFLKAYEKLEQFDRRYRFFSWIYKITVNEALNLIAKRQSSGDLEHEMTDSGADPERQAQGREIGRAIHEAVLGLRPPLRVAIVLRHFHGMSYLEMSEVTGVPVKTVKSRLFTARRELRLSLGRSGLR
ncbi:MAG: RNA polymerase sigma factor [Thermoanaerobaculia bacterium]